MANEWAGLPSAWTGQQSTTDRACVWDAISLVLNERFVCGRYIVTYEHSLTHFLNACPFRVFVERQVFQRGQHFRQNQNPPKYSMEHGCHPQGVRLIQGNLSICVPAHWCPFIFMVQISLSPDLQNSNPASFEWIETKFRFELSGDRCITSFIDQRAAKWCRSALGGCRKSV